jgi:hypothetical protein
LEFVTNRRNGFVNAKGPFVQHDANVALTLKRAYTVKQAAEDAGQPT